MKFQEHYLSENGNEKYCPLQKGRVCSSHCAWFDHEACDCRLMLYIGDLARDKK